MKHDTRGKNHMKKGLKQKGIFFALLLATTICLMVAGGTASYAGTYYTKDKVCKSCVVQETKYAKLYEYAAKTNTSYSKIIKPLPTKIKKPVTSTKPSQTPAPEVTEQAKDIPVIDSITTPPKSAETQQKENIAVKPPVVEPPVVEPPKAVEPPVAEPPKAVEPPVANEVINEAIAEKGFYVSKSGSDSNTGTAASPFKTIQKAANIAKAGDTVYIREGVYNERVLVKNSGDSNNRITFAGYPGEKVVIDGTGIKTPYSYCPSFDVNGQSYLNIINIEVRNSDGQGIGDVDSNVNNTNITIRDCATYDTKISGVHFHNASNIIIDGVHVERANLTADQESITLTGVTNFEIKNCTVINAKKECIDVKDGCSNGKIYGNTIKNARLMAGLAIYVDGAQKGCSKIKIYDNTIDNCIQGIVVASELGGAVNDITIENNDISNTDDALQVAGWGHIQNGSHPMNNIAIKGNNVFGRVGIALILSNPDAKKVSVTGNKLGSAAGTVSIYLAGGNFAETFIDGNTLTKVLAGYPTGTNYALIK